MVGSYFCTNFQRRTVYPSRLLRHSSRRGRESAELPDSLHPVRQPDCQIRSMSWGGHRGFYCKFEVASDSLCWVSTLITLTFSPFLGCCYFVVRWAPMWLSGAAAPWWWPTMTSPRELLLCWWSLQEGCLYHSVIFETDTVGCLRQEKQ